MTCPRCQGLIVNEYDEERCVNCGYRTAFVPPPSAIYRALPVIGPEVTEPRTAALREEASEWMRAYWRKRKRVQKALRPDAQEEAKREKTRTYMRAYMRDYKRGIRRRERAGEVTC